MFILWAKKYAYETKKGETQVKIHGLTLNRCGRHHLHYDGTKRNMLAEAHEPPRDEKLDLLHF